MNDSSSAISLAAFLSSLRAELIRASASSDPKMPLRVEDVTVELTVETTRTSGLEAGLKFWVVSAGGNHSSADTRTQRITINLRPFASDGSPVDISDLESESQVEAWPRPTK